MWDWRGVPQSKPFLIPPLSWRLVNISWGCLYCFFTPLSHRHFHDNSGPLKSPLFTSGRRDVSTRLLWTSILPLRSHCLHTSCNKHIDCLSPKCREAHMTVLFRKKWIWKGDICGHSALIPLSPSSPPPSFLPLPHFPFYLSPSLCFSVFLSLGDTEKSSFPGLSPRLSRHYHTGPSSTPSPRGSTAEPESFAAQLVQL